MLHFLKRYFNIGFLLFSTITIAQITVDNTQSAQDLVNLLFNNSSCATISNFSVSGNNSYASFNKNGSDFSFDEGIVLSSGFVNHTPGPNFSLSSDNLGTSSDTDMANHFSDTFDTTVLEFDFIPLTNYVSFEYLFASEEYQEGNSNTCVFSDVFAFLIKSTSDSDYTNIAVIPNTTIPVQVTTVHPYVTDSCQAENETYFGQWNSQADPTIPINFNGQTATLKASSIVIPGLTYHIKLIIADHTNYQYDSAVFLKAGSFNVGTDLGLDLLRDTNNALCETNKIILDSGIIGASQYKWYVDTLPYDDVFIQVIGENNQTYEVDSEGIYKVVVNLGAGCLSVGEIKIEYESLPIVSDTYLENCNDDLSDFAEFDLTNANESVTNSNSSLIVENFYHSIIDANNKNEPIINYTNYVNTIVNEIIYARIENTSGCASIAKIGLVAYNKPKIASSKEVFYCLNTFPETIILKSGLLTGNTNDYTYQWFYINSDQVINNLNLSTSTIEIINNGIYIVEILSSDGCLVSREITVTNSNTPIIHNTIISETMYVDRISLKIETKEPGNFQYSIDGFNFQDSSIFNSLLYGYHIITVKDKNGCLPNAQKEITILQYQKFFTPNNDKHYDYWNLNNTNSLLSHFNTISDITIFDRFGTTIAVINPNSKGWDGLYNGESAFPADYWFSVQLIDFLGKVTTKTGNFSLVR